MSRYVIGAEDTGDVFLVENGVKTYLPTAEAIYAARFGWEDITWYPTEAAFPGFGSGAGGLQLGGAGPLGIPLIVWVAAVVLFVVLRKKG